LNKKKKKPFIPICEKFLSWLAVAGILYHTYKIKELFMIMKSLILATHPHVVLLIYILVVNMLIIIMYRVENVSLAKSHDTT